MSCHRSSRMSDADRRHGPWGASWGMTGPYGGCQVGWHWRPYEIAATVIAFFVFWPLGLALLFLKMAQRSFGHEGDMFAFARTQAQSVVGGADTAAREWRGPSFMRTTGNTAFDEWREGELARLEEERRKLADAERDFAEHIDQLRRARDRDEFDSFMRQRKGASE